MRQARPGDVDVRGPPANVPKNPGLVGPRFEHGHQDDRIPNLLWDGREPRGGVRLVDGDEATMLFPTDPHAVPPVPHAGEHPAKRDGIRPREGRGQVRGWPRHDRAESREGLRHREILRDLQQLIVPERDEAVDALLEQVELRFRELAADGTFDPERDRGEGERGVSPNPGYP